MCSCSCDDWLDDTVDRAQLDLFEWQPIPVPRVGPPITLALADEILKTHYLPFLKDAGFYSKALLNTFRS